MEKPLLPKNNPFRIKDVSESEEQEYGTVSDWNGVAGVIKGIVEFPVCNFRR